MRAVCCEDFASERHHFRTILCHLDERCQNDSLAGHTAVWHLLLDHVKLGDEAFTRLLSNEITELRQHIASDLDESLV